MTASNSGIRVSFISSSRRNIFQCRASIATKHTQHGGILLRFRTLLSASYYFAKLFFRILNSPSRGILSGCAKPKNIMSRRIGSGPPKNHVEAALLLPQNLSKLWPESSVIRIVGRCLPAWLAQNVRKRHATRACDCNSSQCGNNIEQNFSSRACKGKVAASQSKWGDTARNSSSPPTEIDGIKPYLANTKATYPLIQERSLRKHAEGRKPNLNKE